MNQDVIITMRTSQESPEHGEDDTMDFVTDGVYSFEDNVGRLSYMESEVTGLTGTKTSMTILPDSIIVDREGSLTSRMVFREGEKHAFSYETPFGEASMVLDTKKVRNSFSPSGGMAEIEYVLDYCHRQFVRNRFTINVKRQGENRQCPTV